MITEEQIKNLKPGDKLLIEGTFDRVYCDGDLNIKVKQTDAFTDEITTDEVYIHPSCVSLPSVKPIEMFHITHIPETYPKYDPCRFFKAGDIVSPKGWNDRAPWGVSDNIESSLSKLWKCTVISGERYGIVKCKTDSGYIFETAPCFLELITPVEELEPYSISEGAGIIEIWDRQSELVKTWYYNAVKAGIEALAAAENECARLNAEWRKEQK